jgi:hypothetical protein
MGPHHAEGCDVAVLDAVLRIFFHLGQDVADDFGGVVGGFLRTGYLWHSASVSLEAVVGVGWERTSTAT